MNVFRRLAHSLSFKLLVIFLTTAIALVATLWVSLDVTFQRQFSDNIQPYFSNYLTSLQRQVGFPPDIDAAKRITEEAPVNIVIEAPTFTWSSNGDFIEKPYLDIRVQQPGAQGIASEAGFYKGNFIRRTFSQGYITSFIMTEQLSQGPGLNEIWIIVLTSLAVIAILYAAIYYLFRPVNTIEQGVRRIGGGDVSHRLTIKRNDEIGDLASSINKMADNIEQMLEAKRQLLLAISHELRTPITRAKIALSMMDNSDSKESVEEDMVEMESLIHELLESERLKENHAPLDYHRVNINEIIYQVQGRFFDNSPIILDLADNLPDTLLDPDRIGLAIKNIIKNALTASLKPSDKVIVSTHADKDNLIVHVIDSGVGIAPERIPYLTEPFYRIDSSRQRSTGGFGIGLYLIKAIIDAHQGTLNITSNLNQGTNVSIELPIRTEPPNLIEPANTHQ